MEHPSVVRLALAKALDELQSTNDLKLITRLEIYDSFGPTFSPADYFERIVLLQQGNHRLTTADRIRSRLAIITAEKVLPIWEVKLDEHDADTFVESKSSSGDHFWQRLVLSVPPRDLPNHIVSVANYILDRERVDIKFVFEQLGEYHEFLGWSLGNTEMSERAGCAAYEALEQTLGLGPFNKLPIDSSTTDEDLSWWGAAAVEAMKAYSGVLSDTGSLLIDRTKRKEFWLWWLMDGIPQAWEEDNNDNKVGTDVPSEEMVPFRETVQSTVRKIGKDLFTMHKE